MILETIEVGAFQSNCYVVGSESARKGIVIDPGDDAEAILKAVKRHKLEIGTVVVTHAHMDHISAAAAVVAGTGAKMAMHEAEATRGWFRDIARRQALFFGTPQPELPDIGLELKEGDVVEAGELRFKVLHTPGHSPGGISLYGEGVVFSGDTLFNSGIGRTDFPGCSFEEIMRSIHTKLLTLPDNTVVYPGHGPSTTIGTEKQWNPFVRME